MQATDDHRARFPRRALSPLRLIVVMCLARTVGHGAPVDASLAGFTSQLPVLVLDTLGAGALNAGDASQPVRMELFAPSAEPGMLTATPLVATAATARVRGASSALFPKKSYALHLLDERGSPARHSLLDLAADDDWDLISPWNYDRSFIRNAYVYALSRSLGRWAPRTKFVEVFFRGDQGSLKAGDYLGVSVLTERITIDPEHVNLAPLTPTDPSGGYILKIDPADPDEFTFTTPHLADWKPASDLVVHRPDADELSPAQRDYIRDYVRSMEAALYADAAAGWTSHKHLLYLDRASWVDYHLLQVLSGNVDALQRSCFFTKDRGGKLVAGPPWDFDRSLGSADHRNGPWDQWNSPDATDVWNYGWWGLLTRDPEFMQAWIDRWQQLRRKELSADQLVALADNFAAQLGPAAAARDTARWPDDAGRFADGKWVGEIAQLKTWVANRAAWIDTKFVAPPALETDGVLLSATAPAGAKLAYTLDGSDPRGPNGQLALNARTVTGALTLDASSLLCVRAWNPALTAFPGSPWSAPLTRTEARPVGAATNPAFQSRLANLATFVHLSPTSGAPLTGVVVTGDREKQILVRAVGPGLKQFGLSGTLADPVLSLLDGRGVEIARNVGWTLGADALDLPGLSAGAGAFKLPADSADSALVLRLAPGSYTIRVTSASDASGAALTEIYELDRADSLASLSTCAMVTAAAPVLAGGFIVRGSAPKKFLVRAVGPALAVWGVTGALADPVITLASATGQLARNDGWNSPTAGVSADATADNSAAVAAAATACGAFALPSGGQDAALVVTLAPGAYTAQITSKSGGAGLVLLEVYGVP